MSPIGRVVFIGWPAIVCLTVLGAWVRLNKEIQGSFVDWTVPLLVPLGASLVFLYLLRGGIFGRQSPQGFGMSAILALLTFPVVVGLTQLLVVAMFGV